MIWLPVIWIGVWGIMGAPVSGDEGTAFLVAGGWALAMAALAVLGEALAVVQVIVHRAFLLDQAEETDDV